MEQKIKERLINEIPLLYGLHPYLFKQVLEFIRRIIEEKQRDIANRLADIETVYEEGEGQGYRIEKVDAIIKELVTTDE